MLQAERFVKVTTGDIEDERWFSLILFSSTWCRMIEKRIQRTLPSSTILRGTRLSTVRGWRLECWGVRMKSRDDSILFFNVKETMADLTYLCFPQFSSCLELVATEALRERGLFDFRLNAKRREAGEQGFRSPLSLLSGEVV